LSVPVRSFLPQSDADLVASPWHVCYPGSFDSTDGREVIVGAVTSPITNPAAVIAGVLRDGELVIVGQTGPLSPAQSRELAAHLSPAGADHPWPDQIGSDVFGHRQLVPITKVYPVPVLEVAADPALNAGGYRHLLRYIRLRADMDPTDVEAP
jgi:hypothetical protein